MRPRPEVPPGNLERPRQGLGETFHKGAARLVLSAAWSLPAFPLPTRAPGSPQAPGITAKLNVHRVRAHHLQHEMLSERSLRPTHGEGSPPSPCGPSHEALSLNPGSWVPAAFVWTGIRLCVNWHSGWACREGRGGGRKALSVGHPGPPWSRGRSLP